LSCGKAHARVTAHAGACASTPTWPPSRGAKGCVPNDCLLPLAALRGAADAAALAVSETSARLSAAAPAGADATSPAPACALRALPASPGALPAAPWRAGAGCAVPATAPAHWPHGAGASCCCRGGCPALPAPGCSADAGGLPPAASWTRCAPPARCHARSVWSSAPVSSAAAPGPPGNHAMARTRPACPRSSGPGFSDVPTTSNTCTGSRP